MTIPQSGYQKIVDWGDVPSRLSRACWDEPTSAGAWAETLHTNVVSHRKLEFAMILVGDIGGTKTDLAIYSSESDANSPLARKQFHSADYSSLQAIVTEFLADVKMPVNHATFDVAGPVIKKTAVATNLPWVMDDDSLATDLHLKSVHLMNDLEAVARAIPILRESDVVTLNIGEPVPKTAIGVIAPGAGLGESVLVWDGSRYVPQNSEGGHSDFAPTDTHGSPISGAAQKLT